MAAEGTICRMAHFLVSTPSFSRIDRYGFLWYFVDKSRICGRTAHIAQQVPMWAVFVEAENIRTGGKR
jgi:hypothetical protein